jgi:hypothetical protein
MDLATLGRVGNFDQATINQLAGDTGSLVESISAAGALDPFKYATELTVSGTMAFTLVAPTFAGQKKKITCVSAASTPLGTLTITSPETLAGFVCSATFCFTTAGQVVELEATSGLKWRARRIHKQGVRTLVVGTTVTTGFNLEHFALSVTGTVSSTTTKAIPDGSAPGELLLVGCSTAASIPSGTIGLTALTTLGAAGTTLGTFNATTCYASLMWNGTGWQLTGNTTVVLS